MSLTLLEIGRQKLNLCSLCPIGTRIIVKEKWERGEPFTITIIELPPVTRDEKERACDGCYTIIDREGLDIDF